MADQGASKSGRDLCRVKRPTGLGHLTQALGRLGFSQWTHDGRESLGNVLPFF